MEIREDGGIFLKIPQEKLLEDREMIERNLCNVSHIRWAVAFPTQDGKESAYRRALSALCSHDIFYPTQYAIKDERRRSLFDIDNVQDLGDYLDTMYFWRTRQPRGWGAIVSSGRILGSARLDFHKVRAKYVQPIWNALGELANQLTPEYGTILFHWKDSDREGHLKIFHSSTFRLFFDYYDAGPSGVGARTWFGAKLGAMIGEDLLLEAGATRTDWGGWDLILLDRPWERPFAEVLKRHQIVEEILRRSGQFGQHDIGIAKPGPNWVPIPKNL